MWLTRGGCIWEVPTRGLWLGKIWCFRSVIAYGRCSLARGGHTWIRLDYKVEPRHNKALRDWQNLFAIMRFRYIEVLFHIYFSITGVKKIVSYTVVLVIQRFVILRFDCTIIIKITYLWAALGSKLRALRNLNNVPCKKGQVFVGTSFCFEQWTVKEHFLMAITPSTKQ